MVVATVPRAQEPRRRARARAGRPLPEEYRTENVGFVEAGCCQPAAPHQDGEAFRRVAVVCINAFVTDTKAEIAKVRELCEAAGAARALSTHWEHGGEGALELADAVMDACNDKTEFKPLYSWDMPFKERIELVAREVYGADGVDFSAEASRKLADIQKRDDANELGLCMVKTHLSLSDDPGVKALPRVEAAYPRRAHLRRRGLRGSGFRFHHAHARNGLQSFFPQGRRGRRYRQGEGDLLICVRIGGKPSSGLSSSFF